MKHKAAAAAVAANVLCKFAERGGKSDRGNFQARESECLTREARGKASGFLIFESPGEGI